MQCEIGRRRAAVCQSRLGPRCVCTGLTITQAHIPNIITTQHHMLTAHAEPHLLSLPMHMDPGACESLLLTPNEGGRHSDAGNTQTGVSDSNTQSVQGHRMSDGWREGGAWESEKGREGVMHEGWAREGRSEKGTSTPTLELRIQAAREIVGPADLASATNVIGGQGVDSMNDDLSSVWVGRRDQGTPHHALAQQGQEWGAVVTGGVKSGGGAAAERAKAKEPSVQVVCAVDIVRGCGLQAAVQVRVDWMSRF